MLNRECFERFKWIDVHVHLDANVKALNIDVYFSLLKIITFFSHSVWFTIRGHSFPEHEPDRRLSNAKSFIHTHRWGMLTQSKRDETNVHACVQLIGDWQHNNHREQKIPSKSTAARVSGGVGWHSGWATSRPALYIIALVKHA